MATFLDRPVVDGGALACRERGLVDLVGVVLGSPGVLLRVLICTGDWPR